MKKTHGVVLGSIFLVSAMGCSSTDRDAQSRTGTGVATAPATATATTSAAGRERSEAREEERSLSQQNWQEAKKFLSEKGYNPGTVDGTVNTETRDAIRSFQRQNNIAVTGLLDNQTLLYMEKNGAGFTGSLGGSLRNANADQTLPTTR
jgi:peptidoglycan hydrolase-like protein with peptidoglycan-binding domain